MTAGAASQRARGEAVGAASSANGGLEGEAADAADEQGDVDEVLNSRLRLDASGRVALSDAALAALGTGDRTTRVLLGVGAVVVAIFFGPVAVMRWTRRRRLQGLA